MQLHMVTSSGTWEVEVKAGKEEGSVEFEVELSESNGKHNFTI